VADPVRLTAVRRTGLLDTMSEPSFDRLTRLAARLTGAPVTFVSLVDESRDFYKSCFGFPEPLATTRQMTGTTFCHFAIESEGPLVINDTVADPVYRQVPTVTSLGVRAYLGIPMQLSSGERIGSFCAIDFQPRNWSALDVEVMSELAASTLREIELRMTAEEAERDRRRMGELAESNERLYRQAHEAGEQKDLFFAAVTHELRNPMTSIIGWAQVLRAEVGENPAAAEALAMIEGSARAQARMVNDLLDSARIAAGKMELHRSEVDINSVIEETLRTARTSASEKGVALPFQAGAVPVLPIDRIRVRQILDNLVTNAIKFTPAGGSVTVISASESDAVRIEVRDTGRGLDPEVVAHIFQPGWQVRSAEQGGLGLGLGIARHLTLLHGGSIVAESEGEGKGASFIVRLPLRPGAG
jgi:signal transduction histidine kinase